MNKVAIYYKTTGNPYRDALTWLGSESPIPSDKTAIGGIWGNDGYGTGMKWEFGDYPYGYNWWGNNDSQISGSLYIWKDDAYISAQSSKFLMGYFSTGYNSYASSFRFAKKDKLLTSGPPPHLPMEFNVSDVNTVDAEKSENFYDSIKARLDSNPEYDSGFVSDVRAYLDDIYGN